MRKQSGQAIIEFMIAALFVLVPAFYMVIHLGKVGDLQHRAYEGARYAVWESAKTKKSQTAIQNEVNKRIFYQDYKDFDSVTDRTNNNSTAQLEPLHTHRSDTGTREAFVVLKNGTFNTYTADNDSPGGVYDARLTAVTHGVAGTLKFDLNDNGLITSNVDLITSKTKYLDGLSMHPHALNAMFVEAWRKITNGQVEDAIHDSLAANAIPLDTLVAPIQQLGSFMQMPELSGIDPGHVEPNITSCSRVVGGVGDENAC